MIHPNTCFFSVDDQSFFHNEKKNAQFTVTTHNPRGILEQISCSLITAVFLPQGGFGT